MSAAAAPRESGEIIWLERRRPAPGFTSRDLSELDRWTADDRHAVIDHDEENTFAMLYHGAGPWARWAISRQEGELLVWNCVTFADIGRFGSMLDALASLPCGEPNAIAEASNVVSFATMRVRLQAAG